jgi:ABC-type transporter Mla MlaB component
MAWALSGAPGTDQLAEYEQRLADAAQVSTLGVLCQYDHGRFGAGTLGDIAAIHVVDVSPELAPITRTGYLSAARTGAGATLRLAGELDFACADVVAGVLDAHFHGGLRVDLADVSYADVTGLRALRGREGQTLTIAAASDAVRRLVGLLAWDTDARVELAEMV